MKSLTDLNTAGSALIDFTDERDIGPIFDRPFANNVDQALSFVYEYTIDPTINIIDIIRPTDVNISYIVDVSPFPGTVVSWTTIPTGCTLTENGGVYTISGINSVEQWNIIKTPTITLSTDFQGFFYYNVTISWNSSFGQKTKSWQVGYFIPVSIMETISNVSSKGTAFYTVQLTLEANFNFEASIVSAPMFVNSDLTVSAEVLFAILNDPINIGYFTNISFNLAGAATIAAPNQDNMTLQITPSNPAAIDTIQETYVPSVTSSITYLDPTDTSFRWGSPHGFSANNNYLAVVDYDSFAIGNDTVVRLFDINGTLVRTHTADVNRQTDTIMNSTVYYIEHDATLYNFDGTVFRTGVPGLYDLTDTHYAYVSNNIFYVVELSSNTVVLSDSLLYTGSETQNVANGNLPYYNCLTDTHILIREPGSILTPSYSVYDLSTGLKISTINTGFITSVASINSNAVAFIEDDNDPNSRFVMYDFNGNQLYQDTSLPTDDNNLIHRNNNIFVVTNGNNFYVYSSELYNLVATDALVNIIRGVWVSNNKIYLGDFNSDSIISYNIVYPIIASLDASTKVITLTGSTTQINSLLDEGRLTIVPTTNFTSNFNLTYKAIRSDNKESSVKTQTITNL